MVMADLKEKLSPNFTLEEMVRSETAERFPDLLEQQRNPPAEVVENLRYLCQTTLQPMRDRVSFPIGITSGYRSPGVNQRVGGSPTSQHQVGQAADCGLAPAFLEAGSTAGDVRRHIEERVRTLTGRPIRPDANADFYLFAYVCLHLDELDVDQVIHEYGLGFGQPAWVHVSASRDRSRRQILALGDYVPAEKKFPDLIAALGFGV
jgi:Peptidase M15